MRLNRGRSGRGRVEMVLRSLSRSESPRGLAVLQLSWVAISLLYYITSFINDPRIFCRSPNGLSMSHVRMMS